MKSTRRVLTLAFTLATALPAVADVFPTNLQPPPAGVLECAQPTTFASGAVLSDFTLRLPSNSEPPPVSGTETQQFEMTVRMKLSLGAVSPAQHLSALATVSVSMTAIDATHYSTEMLALDIGGGDMPAGVMLRESPTLASTGQTVLLGNGDGTFRISSFFDIFTEISVDDGATWSPADGPCRVVLNAPSGVITTATPNLLPLNASHFSDADAACGNSVVFRRLKFGQVAESFSPPAEGASQTNQTTGTFAGEVSFDDGKTFSQFSAPAAGNVKLEYQVDGGGTRFFDTELLQLDVASGSLPAPVMLRESPTKASTGRTSITTKTDGTFRIGSFFDVFLEVSLDGGANWQPMLTGPCVFGLPDTIPTALVSVGDPVPAGPGVPAGAVFTSVGVSAINARGDVAFLGKWTSPAGRGTGIFRRISAPANFGTFLVAKVGDTVGGGPGAPGKVITGIKEGPLIDDEGNVSFVGTVEFDPGTVIAVLIGMLLPADQVAVVADTRTPLLDVPGARLKAITTAAPLGGGRVLLIGTLAGRGIGAKNDRVLCATDSAGVLHVVMQEGVTTMTDGTLTVKTFALLQIVPHSAGQARAFNGSGEAVSNVTFTNGKTAIVHTELP